MRFPVKKIEDRSFVLILPRHAAALVVDSPKSGANYPADFDYSCRLEDLRLEEDAHVEKLWSAAPSLGVPLLVAKVPQSYVDCSRSLVDIDLGRGDGRLRAPVRQVDIAKMRHRLVWRKLSGGVSIYSVKLSAVVVRRRIEDYYLPYHDALRKTIKMLRRKHGVVWHLSLHSVSAKECERRGMIPTRVLADFVLGDCGGASCAPQFTQIVSKSLRELGYTVSVNNPSNGAEIVALYGRPRQKRHSLQVGVRRDLYMDEQTREPNAGFEQLRADLALLAKVLVPALSDLAKRLYGPKVPIKKTAEEIDDF